MKDMTVNYSSSEKFSLARSTKAVATSLVMMMNDVVQQDSSDEMFHVALMVLCSNTTPANFSSLFFTVLQF